MREIFISKQRNKNGRKYGFARFKGVKDVYSLERQLDNIILGGLKLYVNIPKYGREKVRNVKPADNPLGGGTRPESDGNQRRHPYQTLNRGSYAEVVAKNDWNPAHRKPYHTNTHSREGSTSSVYLDIPQNGKQWFNEAWVGRLKNLAYFDKVEDDLLWDFGLDVTPKYMGDDLILLLGLTDARAEQMLQEAMEEGESMFHSLEKWSPRLRTGYRLTWVQCWGIPLMAWDTKHIKKIVAAVGDMVEIDDDVEELHRVDRARVLIKTPWRPVIRHTVNTHIQGEIYEVHVVEECGDSSYSYRGRERVDMGSSKEIQSVDSDAGTWVPEEMNGPKSDEEAQTSNEVQIREPAV